MLDTRRPRLLSLGFALAASSLPLLLALLSDSHAASPPLASVQTPQQVADTLDSIIQPRFQKNAGRFGVDRIFELDGHAEVQWVDADSRSERRRFAAVKASHRPYIIAFLHCRHKPGAHIDPPTKPAHLEFIAPKIDALTAVGATQTGAERMYQWADKSLNPVVLPHFAALKQGQPAQAEFENWVIVMRPIRALHESCVTCHAGTKRGDTLGVMVYAVDKNTKIQGQNFVAPGGD